MTGQTSAPRLITLTPTAAGYSSVTMGLLDQTTYGPISSGGWQVVDRPKTVAATQWNDRSPFQLVMTCILDNSITNSNNQSYVEQDCAQLESWLDAVPGGTTYEPTTFSISGPVPGSVTSIIPRLWFIYALEFTDAIRDFAYDTGYRTQQQLKMTCYEYNSPLANAINSRNYSAAAVFSSTQNATVRGTKLYTIKQGDTIDGITAANGGGKNYPTNLKTINNIRDNSILKYMVGQTIILPGL
jgi:hypothetical protein